MCGNDSPLRNKPITFGYRFENKTLRYVSQVQVSACIDCRFHSRFHQLERKLNTKQRKKLDRWRRRYRRRRRTRCWIDVLGKKYLGEINVCARVMVFEFESNTSGPYLRKTVLIARSSRSGGENLFHFLSRAEFGYTNYLNIYICEFPSLSSQSRKKYHFPGFMAIGNVENYHAMKKACTARCFPWWPKG